jgi:hypothetical protein
MSLIGLFFAIVSLLSTAAFSQIPSYAWYDDAGENDGLSEDKPFLIANANELAGFASIVNGVDGRTKDNFSGKFIKLTSDIMLQADTSDWKNWETVPPDEEWIGINGLKGTFDGAGYVIGGVYVFNTSASKGFFTTIGYGGTVKNLGIVASYVIGGYYVGLLAGASSGTIENCYATGNVKGITQVGGLIGVSGGTIENSYATGNVEATANVGGLVGFNENYGVIRNSHATGNVNANNSPSGGLVGTNGSIGYRGTIEKSYATGNVKGSWDVGGLVGYNQPGSKIEESYATGSVEGNREVGGLIGKNNGAAKNSYATGSVEGQRYRGGLVGTNVEGVIENCYAAGSVTEKAVEGEESLNDYFGGLAGNSLGEIVDSYFDSNVYTDEHNGFGYPKSETEMKDKETYENWDFTSIWDMDKEANGGYPFLRHLSVTFIAVENISGVVASAASGGSKSLSAIVKPANATNKAIIWSVVSGNATIDGSNITFNAEGQVKIRATIVNGVAHNVDYTQDFDIEVSAETPVSLPRIATRNINAKAVGKTIILENLPQNAKVQIYNLRGGRIYSVNLENPKILQIGVKTKGIFVVKINNTVLRIPVM